VNLGRGLGPIVAVAAMGCATELLPGEQVLGVDVPVQTWWGTEASRLGDRVAWSGTAAAATAPTAHELWQEGEAGAADATALAWAGDTLVWAGPSGGGVGDEARADLAGVRAMAGFDGAVALAGRDGVALLDGVTFSAAPADAVAVDDDRVAARVCADEGACTLRTWARATGEDLGAVDLPAGDGGALAFVDGALCSGDPALKVEDAGGEVECEDGISILGESGEHLGRAIGGGYVAGGFSARLLPPRARLVPLGEGPIYTLEAGAEAQPLSLAGDAAVLLVGAPFQAHAGAPAGAVFRVDR